MTVLATFRDRDSIVIAADSLRTEDDGSTSLVQKLWSLRSPPTAWGFTGDSEVGLPFKDWLTKQKWPETLCWSDFIERTSEQLAALNSQVSADLRAEVLLVAWMDDVSHVADLPKDPDAAYSEKADRWFFLGSGSHAALTKYVDLVSNGRPQDLATFGLAVDHAAATAKMCGRPVQAVRVSAAGAFPVDLGSDERENSGEGNT